MRRIVLPLAAAIALIWALTALQLASSHTTVPVTTADLVFRSFDVPEASPTPIPGLHEYAVPLRPAPTASPTPERASRPKVAPTAGHTGGGSVRRTIHGELGGLATWFATGRDGFYAAAGPALRAALGPRWRGQHVLVGYQNRAVEVVLNDWCACGPRHGFSTLLDLSDEAFRALAPLSRGTIRVAVDLP